MKNQKKRMQQPLMQDNMRDHWLRGQCELLRPRLLTKLRICGILVFSYAIKRQCTVGLLHYDFASFIFFFLFNFLRFSLLEARWPHGYCVRLRIYWSGFKPWPGSLSVVLRQDTLLSQCFSSPRCTNGYQQIRWG